jgi:hypothetical protein
VIEINRLMFHAVLIKRSTFLYRERIIAETGHLNERNLGRGNRVRRDCAEGRGNEVNEECKKREKSRE